MFVSNSFGRVSQSVLTYLLMILPFLIETFSPFVLLFFSSFTSSRSFSSSDLVKSGFTIALLSMLSSGSPLNFFDSFRKVNLAS